MIYYSSTKGESNVSKKPTHKELTTAGLTDEEDRALRMRLGITIPNLAELPIDSKVDLAPASQRENAAAMLAHMESSAMRKFYARRH